MSQGSGSTRAPASSSESSCLSLPFLTRERQREGQEPKQDHLLLQSKYHVTFFGEMVSRAWIPVSMLKNFQELSLELARVVRERGRHLLRHREQVSVCLFGVLLERVSYSPG